VRLREQSQRHLELPIGTGPPYVGHGRASSLRRASGKALDAPPCIARFTDVFEVVA